MLAGLSTACQGPAPSATQPAFPPASFDHLWAAYTRCVATSDVDSARRHADLLHQAAYRWEEARTFLPSTLDQYVASPPSRLAADPRELATACRDHADRIEQAVARQ